MPPNVEGGFGRPQRFSEGGAECTSRASSSSSLPHSSPPLATGLGAGPFLFVAIHNIPEGLAISLVLVPRGVGALRAAGWSVFSSLPQPLVAVPAFLFVALFEGSCHFGLGFAGGAMLWMVAAQVVPDALATTSRQAVTLALAGSTGAMLALEALLLT